MGDASPYLSIVATARNDDHGGGLARRMQIFVNGVIEQCKRHGLPAELILVEWNPPPDRPRLAEALRWPGSFEPCPVRIIEVPPERHRRFRYAEVLPLFQMIAKNVGIRRARGEFVLATNVDILFSDELMAFLAAQRLEPDRMYRIDRHDVAADVPVEATIDEQLAYCRTHLLRVHRREGSFRLEPDGRPVAALRRMRERLVARRPARDTAKAILRRVWRLVAHWTGSAAADESGPVALHINGSGDFTLLSRRHWIALRGYPEVEMFSFHLDSLFCYAAHHAGVAETVLQEPMRIYHIEHAPGSGWTPEGQRLLFARLADGGIPYLDDATLSRWAAQMQQYAAPMIFNRDDWGLAEDELRETCVGDAEAGLGSRNRGRGALARPAQDRSRSDEPPYLSFVVTSRNDDHGGGLLRRMQIFVNGVIEQCMRHRLPAELVLVEWNPPLDRPRLAEALRWPGSFGPCRVRIIEVPPGRHQKFRYAEVLPLFQMMAKNVGIRRARGEFVLATNVDILFSDELMAFLAAQRLEPDRMYRIDRHDVTGDVPVEATIDEQLAYCRRHLLRVHTREDSYSLEPDGRFALERVDIVETDSGVRLGRGWYQVWNKHEPTGFGRGWYQVWKMHEPTRVVHYRAAGSRAELVITTRDTVASALLMELEPGPSCKDGRLELQFRDGAGTLVAKGTVGRKETIYVKLPIQPNTTHVFVLRVEGDEVSVPSEPRVVKLRLFRCGWADEEEYERAVLPAGFENVRMARGPTPDEGRTTLAGEQTTRPVTAGNSDSEIVSPVALHTNGCGDFTLLSRERWFDLRGYPELETFSFHIDSLFCYAAHHSGVIEAILPEPRRIYHIEHATGSGWTPEGQATLFERLGTKGIPWLDNSAVMAWAVQMRRYHAPMIFNRESWGLAGEGFRETVLGSDVRPESTRPCLGLASEDRSEGPADPDEASRGEEETRWRS